MFHARREQRDVVVGVAEARVARPYEPNLGFGRELVEGAARKDAQVDPQRVGVLRLDDADREPRRAGSELVALEHLNVDTGGREGVGDAAADDATANHEYPCHFDRVVAVRLR